MSKPASSEHGSPISVDVSLGMDTDNAVFEPELPILREAPQPGQYLAFEASIKDLSPKKNDVSETVLAEGFT